MPCELGHRHGLRRVVVVVVHGPACGAADRRVRDHLRYRCVADPVGPVALVRPHDAMPGFEGFDALLVTAHERLPRRFPADPAHVGPLHRVPSERIVEAFEGGFEPPVVGDDVNGERVVRPERVEGDPEHGDLLAELVRRVAVAPGERPPVHRADREVRFLAAFEQRRRRPDPRRPRRIGDPARHPFFEHVDRGLWERAAHGFRHRQPWQDLAVHERAIEIARQRERVPSGACVGVGPLRRRDDGRLRVAEASGLPLGRRAAGQGSACRDLGGRPHRSGVGAHGLEVRVVLLADARRHPPGVPLESETVVVGRFAQFPHHGD